MYSSVHSLIYVFWFFICFSKYLKFYDILNEIMDILKVCSQYFIEDLMRYKERNSVFDSLSKIGLQKNSGRQTFFGGRVLLIIKSAF